MLKEVKLWLLLPVINFKRSHLSICLIYGAFGLYTITAVGSSFWIKEYSDISTLDILKISMFAFIPYVTKIVFSQIIENTHLRISRYKLFIIIGALFKIIGAFIAVDLVNKYTILAHSLSSFYLLSLSAVFMNIGFVIQDIVADSLCAEVVPRDLKPEERKKQISEIQLIARLSFLFAMIIASVSGGYFASNFPFEKVVWLNFLVCLVGLASIIYLPKNLPESESKITKEIIFASIILIAANIMPLFKTDSFLQELVIFINFMIFIYVFSIFVKKYEKHIIQELILLGLILVVVRIHPVVGEGVKWWYIDDIGLDQWFFSYMTILSNIIAMVGSWFLGPYILKQKLIRSMLLICSFKAFFCLPELLIANGFHNFTMEHFGFGARTLIMFDNSLSAPLDVLINVITFSIMTDLAPKINLSTWLSLIACLLNLIGMLNIALGKLLNNVFIIERGYYNNVQGMLTVNFLFILLFPPISIYIINKFRKHPQY